MAKMGYAEAKKIRGESLSNRIASKLVGGESFGASIGKSLSEGTKARITGLKEKINPMNIAKFMTGGSNLGAALAGRITGASKEDMKYFTGKQGKIDTATKIKPIAQDEGIVDLLNEIYLLLEDSRLARLRDIPTEEDIMEKERKAEARHKALLDAINGKLKGGKEVTATKVEEKDEDSIFDNILGAFGLKDIAKSALSGLGRLATFAVGPIGAPLLAAAAIGAFGYFIYKALKAEPSYEAEEAAKGLKQAQDVGGLAGIKDEEERIKKLPEYERTMAELKNAEKTYWKDLDGNPQFGTDKQLEGYAKRGPESAKAVEDYKAQRDSIQKVLEGGTPSEVQAPTPPPAAMATPAAVPVESTPSTAPLSSVTKENLEMNLPINEMATSETINNTNINAQNQTTQPVIDIPSVRNTEETFRRMILYSTRVV